MSDAQNDWIGIFNPNSGGAQSTRWRALKEGLISRNIPVIETRSTHDLQVQLSQWIDAGGKGVILSGGDGSLHQGINALYNTGVPISNINLAFLPCGTGNDWAGYRGVSKEPDDLLEKLSVPSYFRAPLCQIKSLSDHRVRIFANITGIGFDAYVVQEIEKSKKRSKSIYLKKVIASLNKYRSQLIFWEMDGASQSADVFSMHIGIGKTAGGGLQILPHASDEGIKMAVTIVKKASTANYFRSVPRLLRGGIQGLSFVDQYETEHIKVMGDQLEAGVECDGEYFGTTPVEIIRLEDNLKVLDTRRASA